MLLLLIQLGGDLYGLDVMDVIEVIPRIEARPVPQAPEYVVGLISYRGTVVPLIDLKLLMMKEPCVPWLSTRIIVTEYDTAEEGAGEGDTSGKSKMTLAILGERVTETVLVERSELKSSGIELSEQSYLGQIAMREKRIVQILRLAHILPPELKEMLSRAARSR